MHATCCDHLISLTSSFNLYLAKNTSYKANHFAVFSNLLSLPPSLYTFMNTLLSNVHRLCFTLIQIHKQNYSFVCFNLYILYSKEEEQKRLWTELQKALSEFLMLLISSWINFDLLLLSSHIWTCHISRGSIIHLYVMIFLCITSYRFTLSFVAIVSLSGLVGFIYVCQLRYRQLYKISHLYKA